MLTSKNSSRIGPIMHLTILTSLLFAAILQQARAVVQPDNIPLDLARCFGRFKRKTTLTKTPAASIQSYCENMYLWSHAKELNANTGINPQTSSYINGLFQTTRQEILQHRLSRKKRQTGIKGSPSAKPLVRKEIRMMSDKEIETFFAAINSAKQNTTIEPNKYDALAKLHTGIVSLSAHGGCNFLGWHRMYLLMYEKALREEGPEYAEVTVPYWDSTLDGRMEDPRKTALFTDRLMGSCHGQAKGGVMGTGWNSSAGVITRNCATDGPLVTEEMIYNVTRHTRMSSICGEDCEVYDDLEIHHDGVHRWIGGQMSYLPSAVYDPIFWLHHCFVDYIWEKFRENQRKAGVKLETDYPVNPSVLGSHELHLPEADMGFANLKVIDGLSELFTSEWYIYAPRPTCHQGKQDCESKYLKCVLSKHVNGTDLDQVQGRYECVARTLKEAEEYEANGNKRTNESCTIKSENKTDNTLTQKAILPIQNTFCMNGKSDIGEWVYIPVKIILKIPPEYDDYGSYPVEHGEIQKLSYPVEHGEIQKLSGDIYSASASSNIDRYMKSPETQAKYDGCVEPESPVNEIYVKSTGINYEGVYKEYAIMDKRLAMSVATAYIAVRKPFSNSNSSVAVLSAQDSCGRICKPICKVPGTEIFRPCSGAVKVTSTFPLEYGNSFGEAVLNVWDINTDKNCPQLTTNNIIVSFFCDYSTEWLWPSIEPTPSNTKKGLKSLGDGCFVSSLVDTRSCVHGQVLECYNACYRFALCVYNKFRIYRCNMDERHYMKGLCKCDASSSFQD